MCTASYRGNLASPKTATVDFELLEFGRSKDKERRPMHCPPIHGLEFDRSDIVALQRLRELPRNRKLLEAALPAGVMATIFLGNNSSQASYNILNTDWETLAQAMASASAIERNAFIQTARLQQLRTGSTHPQRQFWKAVENGCKGY